MPPSRPLLAATSSASPAPLRQTVDPRAAAREERLLQGRWPAASLERLQESVADVAQLAGQPAPVQAHAVDWSARFELREAATDEARNRQDVWLHLSVTAQVPLVCQRCLALYLEPLEVDRWFRFVKDEATAEAQDDEAEEDLLVLDPRFDLSALVEDELLLALPLIPLHAECPQPLVLPAEGEDPQSTDSPQPSERPHPFAALEALRKK